MGIASKGPRIALRELRRGCTVSGQEFSRIDRELVFRELSGVDSVVTSFDPNTPLKGSTSTSYTTQKPCKESSRLLDLLPGNYTLNSFKNQHYSRKTCSLRRIHLPSNYSGINLDAVRFPCGILR
ncbi:hypothetical protein F2Q70_00001563 [Brassica cretica]|uniref:Uncharacterized protein n=1 Tax=Brassica cretica TaxID=69181 RepID=A0A8S9IME2_BRACR|nr:hypothetical protein F2Q70_00001563 [Brassica cretica]